MVELSLVGMALVPVVVGLVSVAKIYIESKWAPLIALGLGCLLAWLVPDTAVAGSWFLGGIMIGLAASGLYSGSKAFFS